MAFLHSPRKPAVPHYEDRSPVGVVPGSRYSRCNEAAYSFFWHHAAAVEYHHATKTLREYMSGCIDLPIQLFS